MNIVMLCNLGMSTGMMVKKLEQEAAKRNLEATVPVSYTHLTLPTTPYV